MMELKVVENTTYIVVCPDKTPPLVAENFQTRQEADAWANGYKIGWIHACNENEESAGTKKEEGESWE